MKPFEIRAKLKEMGFKEDRYGNMLTPKGKYRIHFNSISLRVEKKYVMEESAVKGSTVNGRYVQEIIKKPVTHWQNLRTVYYKDVGIAGGKLCLGQQELADHAAPAVAA